LFAIMVAVAAIVVVPTDADADLTFNGTIQGTVTLWGTGEPVAGAEVRGVYESGFVSATTDAEGRYRLENLETGNYNVVFLRTGAGDPFWYYPGTYEATEATVLTIVDDEVYPNVDGAVQDEGTMIGRVVDDTTGLPIDGICADVRDASDTVVGTAVSDVDGWLLYPEVSVSTGDEWLESSALLYDCNDLGYADEWYRDSPIERGDGSPIVEYLAGRGRFDAEVGAPATIAGTVTDGSDPLAGICVSLNYPHLDLGTATTDNAGYYEFTDLTAGDLYTLDFEDCNVPIAHQSVLGVDATAISGTVSDYDQVLQPTASISGTVTDASTGLPLDGICVLGTEDWIMQSRFAMDTTDASGVYSLEVPAAATQQYVRAYWCGDTPRPYEEQWWDGVTTFEGATDLAVGAGELRTGVDLAMPAMASLHGTLTGVDGLPAATYIRLVPQFDDAQWVPSAMSDADGMYRIDNIEAGPYLIRFGDDGVTSNYVPEWYDNVAAEEEATPVVFDWGEVVTIDAELAQMGVVEWDFAPVGFEANPTMCAFLTDTGGQAIAQVADSLVSHFVIGGLVAGDYLLYAEDCDTVSPEVAPAWHPNAATRSDAVAISVDGDTTNLGDWSLNDEIPAASTVSGTTTRDGEPLDACVTVFDENLAVVATTLAVGGAYTTDGVVLHGPEAAVRVKAADCDDPSAAAWYGGATGEEATQIPFGLGIDWSGIHIEVPQPVAMQLTVAAEDLLGRPLPKVCVALSGDAADLARTGGDGAVSFVVAAGDYTVTAGVAGTGCVTAYDQESRDINVSRATRVSIRLALPTGFTDTDDTVFAADIAWLAGAGITLGCNPPLNTEYCPEEVVTRGQMAAFLVRALGLTDQLDNPFTDDDDSVFEADIEKLAAAGITTGCNPPDNDMFCGREPVTRGQMAAFLVRAMGYSDAGPGDLFIDDDGSLFESAIDRLATAGVTKGCNPPANDMFCPSAVVTRGQMAAFLHRALG
jgi:hypothetical protein